MPATVSPATFSRLEAPAGAALTRALLACGVVYALLYVVTNDVLAASLYPGYSRLNQAVSELSATGAPSRGFLRPMVLTTLLLLAFGAGVWRAAEGKRSLRVTGALIFFGGILGVSWLWFPMTSREQKGQGAMAANDVGHLVLSGLTVALILAEMGFSAAGMPRWFRVFTAFCAAAMLGFGVAMSVMAPGVSQGPTPLMGLYERLMLGGWLAWMAVFGVTLMRRVGGRAAAVSTARSPAAPTVR